MVLAMVVALLPGGTRADDAAKAKALFKSAVSAYNLGEFDQALKLYTEIYKLQPLPDLLFNIGQCHRQMGNFERAQFFFNRFLDTAPTNPNIEIARSLMAEMKTKQEAADKATQTQEGRAPDVSPFRGVALEDWAAGRAQLAQNRSSASVLQVLGVGPSEWEEVNTEWMARMKRDSTGTIAAVFDRAFSGEVQGKFAPPTKGMSEPTRRESDAPRVAALEPSARPPVGEVVSDHSATAPSQVEPLYKKWWFWTAVGVVVVGGAVAGAAALSPAPNLCRNADICLDLRTK